MTRYKYSMLHICTQDRKRTETNLQQTINGATCFRTKVVVNRGLKFDSNWKGNTHSVFPVSIHLWDFRAKAFCFQRDKIDTFHHPPWLARMTKCWSLCYRRWMSGKRKRNKCISSGKHVVFILRHGMCWVGVWQCKIINRAENGRKKLAQSSIWRCRFRAACSPKRFQMSRRHPLTSEAGYRYVCRV